MREQIQVQQEPRGPLKGRNGLVGGRVSARRENLLQEPKMNSIIYIIGLVVVVAVVLSFLGFA